MNDIEKSSGVSSELETDKNVIDRCFFLCIYGTQMGERYREKIVEMKISSRRAHELVLLIFFASTFARSNRKYV